MITAMSDYEISDYIMIDFAEVGDLINFAGNDYLIKEMNYNPEGWDLIVIDRYEDELDLFIPDSTVVGLITEE